jgi:GH18 family chitinase
LKISPSFNFFNQIQAPAPSRTTQFVQTSGTAAYFEFCEMLEDKTTERYVDASTRSPYLIYKGDQWFSYEDEESVKIKVKFLF